MINSDQNFIVEVNDAKLKLEGKWIHNGVSLRIKRGEIFAIVGGSGTGKSMLLREILMLQPLSSGSIHILGKCLQNISSKEFNELQKHWGVMFQQGALFSALTILENVAFPLFEFTKLDKITIENLAKLKILSTGLPLDAITKYPAELSGGMLKRAAIARAIVMDPEIIFLDEPTAGLDPQSAADIDELILSLKSNLGLTIIMVTHDLDSLWQIADKVAFLGAEKVLAIAPMQELVKSSEPMIQTYFSGKRGRIAQQIYQK